jgi:acyl-coenzyme A thioesterase PaaI-like protein
MSKDAFSTKIATLVEEGKWGEIEAHFNHGNFVRHMGFSVSLVDPQQPRCSIKKHADFQLGGVGQDFVNGGVIAAMFDFVIGLTALRFASLGNFATTNVNISLIRPVKQSGAYATAKCNRQIGRRLLVESVLFDGEDNPCCHANGEIRVGIRSGDT